MTHSSWLHDCAEGMNSNMSLVLTFPSDSSRTVNEGDVQMNDLRSGNWRTVGDVARDISGIVNFWKNFAVALHQLWLGGKSRMTLDSLCTCCRWMSFEAWWMFSDVDVPRGVPFILGVQERHSTCFTITSCKRWSWKLSNYVKSFVTERLSSNNIDVYKYVCIYIYIYMCILFMYIIVIQILTSCISIHRGFLWIHPESRSQWHPSCTRQMICVHGGHGRRRAREKLCISSSYIYGLWYLVLVPH